MSGLRKICIVTGSRAEYGLLYWLLKEIEARPDLDLALLVTGMHLDQRFGDTRAEIEADGFAIAGAVEMLQPDDTPLAIARSLGTGIPGMAQEIDRLAPDIVIVVGDRFETLAGAQAAMLLGIPIAHLHGGEATEGAIDDSIRHAITKMARFHFAAAEPYARRIVQMGEDPDRVFVVGALAADNISRVQLSDRETLSQSVGLKLGEPLFVVTYHPTTAQAEGDGKAIAALAAALEGVLADHPDATVIVTGTNADAGHAAIGAALDEFAARHPGRVICVQSLGREPYVSAVALADAVVGNSSSGIIEAPLLGTPTVNIGAREKGRLRAPSVIDAAPNEKSIADAIRRALGDDMRAIAARRQSPYVVGEPAAEIANILAAVKLGQTAKPFHDMAFGEAEVSP